MASPTVDRRFGLVGNIAMKAPVTALAAGNIAQSGEQIVDGVAVKAINAAGVPDRVLCTGMTDATKNGIFDVSTAAWTRSKDADGNYDFGQGSTVLVNNGSTYAGSYWKITTAGPITIGTTLLAWARALASSISTLFFQQAGVGALLRGAQDKMRERISPDDFAVPATSAAALTAIETAWPVGVGVRIPTGTYILEAALTLAQNRMNIQGAGRFATILQYNLAAAGPAITINNVAVGGYNQGRLADICFSTSNGTAKTFLDLYNVANYEVTRLATNSGLWLGDSIAVRTRGRQLVHIHGCELGCARPIVISPNAAFPSIATDHFLIEDNELIGSSATRDVIEIETGVSFSNTTIRHCAVVGGRHGIYWNDTTSTLASFALLIDEIRVEQGLDAAAYCVYLASTAQFLQQVKISNSYLDIARNGIYLRNAQAVTIDNVIYAGGAGKTALDITMIDGSRLILRNFYAQNGSTITITNGRCIRKEISVGGAGLVHNEEWVYDSGTGYAEGMTESASYQAGTQVTLAPGATAVVAGGTYQGWLEVNSHTGGVGGEIYCRGTFLTTFVGSVSDAGFFGNAAAASQYNVYASGGNFILQNNTAGTVRFRVRRSGGT